MSITDAELLERARAATANSYVAYSGFPVGAALLLDDGTVVERGRPDDLLNRGDRFAAFWAHAHRGVPT